MDRYQNLANGIVEQAASDYRRALKGLKNKPDDPDAYLWIKTVVECEKFFKGEWIKVLTNIDGESIMNKIKDEFQK